MNKVVNVPVSDTTGDAIKRHAGKKRITQKFLQPVKSFWSFIQTELLNQTSSSRQTLLFHNIHKTFRRTKKVLLLF